MRVPELLMGNAHLVIQASPQLARTLRRASLVQTLRLLLQPLVAGSGPALFEPDGAYDLTLRAARTTRGRCGARLPFD